jgi:hypothetical protein
LDRIVGDVGDVGVELEYMQSTFNQGFETSCATNALLEPKGAPR